MSLSSAPIVIAVCLASICLSTSASGNQQSVSVLTNHDIVTMVQAGLSADVILAKISKSTCAFDTSTEGLMALKAANVPDGVILAMINAAPSAKDVPIVRMARVTCLTVREIPLIADPKTLQEIRKLPCSTDIAILDESGSWVKVRTMDGAVGFLSAVFVSKPAPAASLPTSAAPAAESRPDKSIPSGMVRAIAWRAIPWVTTSYYQTQGSASTQCAGSGSWIGDFWQSNSSCSTQYTPAQTIPMNWEHVTVFNLVETTEGRMLIACTRNWAFSKCSYLVPGDLFRYEMKSGKVEIFGQKGNGKEAHLNFDVLSRRQN